MIPFEKNGYLVNNDHLGRKLNSEVDGEENHPYGGAEGKTPAKDGSWKPIPSGENSTRPIHSLPIKAFETNYITKVTNLKQCDGSWCAVNIRVS